ncbi:MAG: HAMP domain-containing sensor histidine kinase [Candidatus Pseudobacter hemicellulosilyticus]|uniref:histidine kinase n=1 Tax=Candidatus Pseudobacter hemicellulosilyticus TaxID=3121375 RepID=A0AAJ5WQD2_9BACT|nr:MAG: HAMP domain-containing sensor histidine kinase [Pseudobacter sp.]
MKIRNRLSLEFTLLTAGMMLLVFILIYTLFTDYINQVFYARLRDRALITAEVYLEQDELTRKNFLDIQQKYLHTLPDEQSFIFNERNVGSFNTAPSSTVPPEIIEAIRQGNRSHFILEGQPAAGIFYNDNQGDFVIIVTARNVTGIDHRQNLLLFLCIIYGVVLPLIYLLSLRFAGKSLRPIKHINRKLKEIRSRNLHERVEVPQNKDEINELANNFNDLLSHLQLAFETQRSFVSNASHELRTPLTAIIGELEVMLSKPRTEAEYRATMHSVLAESEKLNTILAQLFELSNYSDHNTAAFRETDLTDMLRDLCMEWEAKGYPCTLQAPDRAVSIKGNPVLLETALNNILKNAFKFSAGLPVKVQLDTDPGIAFISITDQGIGIPEKDLSQVFTPFFRADNARGYPGSGVGLSITEKIIRLHQGSVQVSSAVGVGTIFHISLPLRSTF